MVKFNKFHVEVFADCTVNIRKRTRTKTGVRWKEIKKFNVEIMN